jgi:8-oxo-dGTP pyrophosphatase MutT (NUDIX family)
MDTLTLEEIGRRLSRSSRRTVPESGLRKAAVLVPLITASTGPDLLLTLRTHTVETHKGQVAFPGGMADEGDGDATETALREAEEELGLRRHCVVVAGLLDELETPTGFHVTPVVGLVEELPVLEPNPHEVAEVFRVPLAFFADPASGMAELRVIRGRQFTTWIYTYEGRTIWGVSAAIIRSLLSRLATTP